MGKLIYATTMSMDGFTEDPQGSFDWSEPDEEVHQFFNDLIRPMGVHLYGRRMYETMKVWETDPSLINDSPITRDFAGIWQAADKFVYSRTLEVAETARTHIEKNFDPETIRKMKLTLREDSLIGGPEIAAFAFAANLVDEVHLFVVPVSLGGGKSALPKNMQLHFELLEERKFGNGTVQLHYRIRA